MAEPTLTELLVPKFRDECTVSRGVEVVDMVKVRKETILYIQPCASERGRLMADVELTKEPATEFIHPEALCFLLEVNRRHFAELKCSPSLGVAKLKWKGREISVFRTGKLKIQRALNREEILRIANSAARMIWGAVICEVCRQPALSCASGRCGKCAYGEKVAVWIGEIPSAELLSHAYTNLEKARKVPTEESGELVRRAQYLALHFMIEAPKKEDAVLGLILLAETQGMSLR